MSKMSKVNAKLKTQNAKLFQLDAKIIFNKKIVGDYYKMRLGAPEIAKHAAPGQFLNIKINETYKPLLRKPLGIHSVSEDKKHIEILYKVVGEGTKLLSDKKKDDYFDVLGPLGNGFTALDSQCSILVAGGIGVAPLIFLAEKLAEIKNQKSKIKNLVLIGTKTKSHILCEKEFKDLGCEVKVATDDGSCGFKGNVTDLLRRDLSAMSYEPSAIYACGPKPMLKATAEISKKFKAPCFGLLEEYMACGTGACFGCAVATKSGFKRVCKDGPVFDLNIIEW